MTNDHPVVVIQRDGQHSLMTRPPNDTTIPLRNTDQPATENTMEKRPCLVWWPRIWTQNSMEPTRTSATGRDSWDG